MPASRPARSRSRSRTTRAEVPAENDEKLGLPSFITGGPVVAREPVEKDASTADDGQEDGAEGEVRTARRRRRYRPRSEQMDEAGEASETSEKQAVPGE